MNYPQYDPNSDHLPLSDDELGALDEALSDVDSDACMNIEALDGYLSALLLSPQRLADLPGAAWLPVVWGGDTDSDSNAPFGSGKQKKRVVVWTLRHLQSIAMQWQHQPKAWEPILSIAETEDGDEFTDAEDWCAGFLSGVALAPAAWEPLFQNAETAALLEPITLLGSDESELDDAARARLADPKERDALSRAVPENALALFARAR